MKSLLFVLILCTFSVYAQIPQFQWAFETPGCQTKTILTDNTNNIYVFGSFNGTVDFDLSNNNYSLTCSAGSFSNGFIMKLAPNGDFIWVKQLIASSNFSIDGAVINNNNIFITGNHTGTTDFDPGTNNYIINGSVTDLDTYFAKYDLNGEFVFAKALEGTSSITNTAINIDNTNNILIGGYLTQSGSTDFDTDNIGQSFLNSDPNGSQSFIAKYDNLGNFIWVKQFNIVGTTESNKVKQLHVDINNNVNIIGEFVGTNDFDPSGNQQLATSVSPGPSISPNTNMFFTILDQNGLYINNYTLPIINANAIINKTTNDLFITGILSISGIDFNFDAGVNTLSINNSNADCFILKYNLTTGFQWVININGNQESRPNISQFTNGNIVVTNKFLNTEDFDPSANTFNMTATGFEAFIAIYDPAGNFLNASKFGSNVAIGSTSVEQTITDNQNSIISVGMNSHTADMDPGTNTIIFNSNPYIQKLAFCTNTASIINQTSCGAYTAPDGQVHNASGTYTATIPNTQGCDSVITINLTIKQNTTSTINPNSCGAYTAADGQVYNSSGTYTATIPNSVGCDSLITINLTVLPIPIISAGPNQTICSGNTVILIGTGGVSYTWDNSVINGSPFTPPIGTNQYTVTGTSSNGCTNTDQVSIIVNPLPVVTFTVDKTTGCTPLQFNLTNTTPNSSNCIWDVSNSQDYTGCGTIAGEIYQVGCHDITLTTTDINGCINSFTASSVICVEPKPLASFTATPNSFSQPGETIVFTNNSSGATSYSWNFGDQSTLSTIINPTHVYQDGIQSSYLVELIAYSSNGCTDTAYMTIYYTNPETIDPEVFIPTGFSPNGDNENEQWEIEGLEKYPNTKIFVYNRWGQVVFEGDQTNNSWDGTYQGKKMPTADYYFTIDLGDGQKYKGTVTLKY